MILVPCEGLIIKFFYNICDFSLLDPNLGKLEYPFSQSKQLSSV
jgi:hypothetical protein